MVITESGQITGYPQPISSSQTHAIYRWLSYVEDCKSLVHYNFDIRNWVAILQHRPNKVMKLFNTSWLSPLPQTQYSTPLVDLLLG